MKTKTKFAKTILSALTRSPCLGERSRVGARLHPGALLLLVACCDAKKPSSRCGFSHPNPAANKQQKNKKAKHENKHCWSIGR